MKKLLTLLIFIGFLITSCSKSTTDPLEENKTETPEQKDKIIEKYSSIIPGLNKYSFGIENSTILENYTLLAFNNQSNAVVYYLDKNNKIIYSKEIEVRGDKSINKKLSNFQTNESLSKTNGVIVIFIDVPVSGSLTSTDPKQVDLLCISDNKLVKIGAKSDGFNELEMRQLGYSNGYIHFINDGGNFYIFKLSDGQLLKHYSNWNAWLNNTPYFISSDAQNVVKLVSNQLFRADLSSEKIELLNGEVVKNWKKEIVYFSGVKKEGETVEIKSSLYSENTNVVVEYSVYTKLWNGNNQLVENTESKKLKFDLSTGAEVK